MSRRLVTSIALLLALTASACTKGSDATGQGGETGGVKAGPGVTATTIKIVGNAPVFTPQLLRTPAATALEDNLYVVTALAPPSLAADGVRQFLRAFQAR